MGRSWTRCGRLRYVMALAALGLLAAGSGAADARSPGAGSSRAFTISVRASRTSVAPGVVVRLSGRVSLAAPGGDPLPADAASASFFVDPQGPAARDAQDSQYQAETQALEYIAGQPGTERFGCFSWDSCSSGGERGGPRWSAVDVRGAGLCPAIVAR
jgi:hypothetical protein